MKNNIKLFSELKDQLIYSPNKVKESFNILVGYFDKLDAESLRDNIDQSTYDDMQEFWWYVKFEIVPALKRRSDNPSWEGVYKIDKWYTSRVTKYSKYLSKDEIKKLGKTFIWKPFIAAPGGKMSRNDVGYVYDCYRDTYVAMEEIFKLLNKKFKNKDWYYTH
jgi:hypothetical protein